MAEITDPSRNSSMWFRGPDPTLLSGMGIWIGASQGKHCIFLDTMIISEVGPGLKTVQKTCLDPLVAGIPIYAMSFSVCTVNPAMTWREPVWEYNQCRIKCTKDMERDQIFMTLFECLESVTSPIPGSLNHSPNLNQFEFCLCKYYETWDIIYPNFVGFAVRKGHVSDVYNFQNGDLFIFFLHTEKIENWDSENLIDFPEVTKEPWGSTEFGIGFVWFQRKSSSSSWGRPHLPSIQKRYYSQWEFYAEIVCVCVCVYMCII